MDSVTVVLWRRIGVEFRVSRLIQTYPSGCGSGERRTIGPNIH
jgi:hypothetical protein